MVPYHWAFIYADSLLSFLSGYWIHSHLWLIETQSCSWSMLHIKNYSGSKRRNIVWLSLPSKLPGVCYYLDKMHGGRLSSVTALPGHSHLQCRDDVASLVKLFWTFWGDLTFHPPSFLFHVCMSCQIQTRNLLKRARYSYLPIEIFFLSPI